MIRTLSFIILTPWLQKIISNALNKCRSRRRVRCFDLKGKILSGKIPVSSAIAGLRSEGNSLSQDEPVTDQTRSHEASNSPQDRKDGIRIARKYLNVAGPLCTSFSNFHQTYVGNLCLILAHFNHPSYS